jgi:FixJ family two-component response regulator
MKNGAVDFLLKPFDGDELIEAAKKALLRGKECLRTRAERRQARKSDR